MFWKFQINRDNLQSASSSKPMHNCTYIDSATQELVLELFKHVDSRTLWTNWIIL